MKYTSIGENSLWDFIIENPDMKDIIGDDIDMLSSSVSESIKTGNILVIRLLEVEDSSEELELYFIDRVDKRVSKFLFHLLDYKKDISAKLNIYNREREVIKTIPYNLSFQKGSINLDKNRISEDPIEILGEVRIKFNKVN